jgi:streptogramin lyase
MRSPGLAGAAALTALAMLVAGCGAEPDTAPNPGGTSSSPVSASTTEPAAEATAEVLPEQVSVADAGGETLDAGPENDFAIAAASGIWVSGVPPGLVRYEAATGEVTHRIRVASTVVQGLDATDGRVWVVGLEPDVLLVVDASLGEVVSRVDLPEHPLPESSLGASGDVAWVLVDRAGPRILRIDTGTGEITRLRTPPEATALRYGDGSLWVTTYDSVERLDPRTGRRQDVFTTADGSSFLTFAYGCVWVLSQIDGAVSKVDAATGEVTVIPAGDRAVNGGDIAASDGYVWVRTWDGVTVVEPRVGVAAARVGTEGGSGSVAAADGWIWITDHDHSAIHRVPWPFAS